MCTDNNGAIPLHFACSNGKLDVVQYLITECKCDPMCKTLLFNTSLDIACKESQYDVVEYILTNCIVYSSFKPRKYLTNDRMKPLLNKFFKLESCVSANSFVNVFLLGSSGVGKSTLTKVINMRANGSFLFGGYRSVSSVELLTAGIIPHTLEHKELGNIILHDLAGQPEYYSSHSAIIENILNGSSAVFVIVAKLSDDPPYKWLSLVKDLCSKCSSVCYLLTVASHADAINNERERLQFTQKLQTQIKLYTANEEKLHTSGIAYLDCRKLDSEQFSSFKYSLSHACQLIRSKKRPIFNYHKQLINFCKSIYLLFRSKRESVYSLDEVFELVEMSEYFLPKSLTELSETLHHLHRTGLIMFIETPRGSWIVIKKESLLAEVNGIIFAPKSFKIYQNLASNTGQL